MSTGTENGRWRYAHHGTAVVVLGKTYSDAASRLDRKALAVGRDVVQNPAAVADLDRCGERARHLLGDPRSNIVALVEYTRDADLDLAAAVVRDRDMVAAVAEELRVGL